MTLKTRVVLGTLSALVAGYPAAALAQAGPGFRDVSDGLTSQISPFASMITTLAFVFGIGLVMIGLLKFKKFMDRPGDENRPLVAIVFVVAGGAIIALPSSISSGVSTIFGNGAPTATAYGGGTQVLPFVNRQPDSFGGN